MKRHALRRIVSALLLSALLAGSVPAGAVGGFSDVPENHWAADAIERCVELGLFKGETPERFGVGNKMTRSAFAVVLCRFFGWQASETPRAIYSDVPLTAWYADEVQAAYEHGAITLQSGAFRPREHITREELTVMLVRALGCGGIAGLAQEDELPFWDVDTNAGYIAMAYELGIVNGTSSETFSPKRTASREQAAVMLMRLYDRLNTPVKTTMGVLTDDTELPKDLSVYETLAISAAELRGVSARLDSVMSLRKEQSLVSAAKESGAQVLLHVTGAANVLEAEEERTAQTLVEAVERGGYDGLYLDIAQPDAAALTALCAAVRAALPEGGLFYVAVQAPERGGAAVNYAALGSCVDRLVVKTTSEADVSTGFPMAPQEAPEAIYYGLTTLREQVPEKKLVLQLTTTGSRWSGTRYVEEVRAAEVEELLERANTTRHRSARYHAAYLQNGSTVVWYLDEAAVTARREMAACLGVTEICLSDLSDLPEGFR